MGPDFDGAQAFAELCCDLRKRTLLEPMQLQDLALSAAGDCEQKGVQPTVKLGGCLRIPASFDAEGWAAQWRRS